MYKQYRKRVDRDDSPEAYWSDHWSGSGIEVLEQGLERTELWRAFEHRLPRGARVLEAGCGPGHWVKFLGERGYCAMGVDLAGSTLEETRKAVPSLPLIRADLAQVPFVDQAFDAYISLGVIEHFEEGPGSILAEASRVVAPGGVLIFTVPYLSLVRRLVLFRHRRSLPQKEPSAVFYQYVMTGRELERLLTRHGFEVLRVQLYEVEGGVQNRMPVVGDVKNKLRGSRSPLIQRVIPILHDGWDLFMKILPAFVLAQMVLAVCRKPPDGKVCGS